MDQEVKEQEKMRSPSDLIDLESFLPEMIETFSKDIDSEYLIENFQMKIDEDGITLYDQKELMYELNELNTGQQQFFKQFKDKVVTISQGIVKPEFETNQHNLIFTLYAKDIKLTHPQEELVGDSQPIQEENVFARFKMFDMEHNKKKQNIYEKAFVVKKALVRAEEEQEKLLKQQQQQQQHQQQQDQNKKSGPKRSAQRELNSAEQDEDDKKQQFKTPSKKGKTPLKIQEEKKVLSAKKGLKVTRETEESEQNNQQKKLMKGEMEIEEDEEDQEGEGAVSVAKDRKAISKEKLIQTHRVNLQALYEAENQQKVSPKKPNNKKKTVQIEDVEYEEEEDDQEEDSNEEEDEVDEEVVDEEEEEVDADEEQDIENESTRLDKKQKKISDDKKSIKKQDHPHPHPHPNHNQGFETDMKDEKDIKKSCIKVASVQKQKEIISSLKKKSIDRMKEQQREIEEKENEEVNALHAKQLEFQNKLAKLQKFVLKKEFLYYIGANDFQKKPEVRNAVLPRDPLDKEKMKQYSQRVVKYLESQYK